MKSLNHLKRPSLHSNFGQEASWVEVEFSYEKVFVQLVEKLGPCHLEKLTLLIAI